MENQTVETVQMRETAVSPCAGIIFFICILVSEE